MQVLYYASAVWPSGGKYSTFILRMADLAGMQAMVGLIPEVRISLTIIKIVQK